MATLSVAKMEALEICCRILGIQLSPEQEAAVTSILKQRDVFVSLPTGAGKSICYAILPLLFDTIKKTKGSIVIVTSPLLALMKDQARIFNEKGIRTVYIESDHDDANADEEVMQGEYQVVLFGPERILQSSKWRKMLLSSVYQEN